VNKMNVKQLVIATAGALIIYGNSAMAGTVGSMTPFTSGTAAVAADVNANFDAVKAAVDDNDTRITSNTTDIGTNTTDIGTNTTNIGTNTTDIGTNATDIGTNATAISALNARIAALEGAGGLLTMDSIAGTYTAMGQDIEITGVASNFTDNNGNAEIVVISDKTNLVINADGTCSINNIFYKETELIINAGTWVDTAEYTGWEPAFVDITQLNDPGTFSCTYTLSNNVVTINGDTSIHMTSNGQMGIARASDSVGHISTITIVKQP